MRQTIFSPCRRYRYTLWREFDLFNPGYAMFIGLNPSTADERNNDPTVRRCISFAQTWGFGSLCMTNIFAYRATDPNEMKRQADPVGPDNDKWLTDMAAKAGIVIAAWGVLSTLLHTQACLWMPVVDRGGGHGIWLLFEWDSANFC